VRFLGNRSSGRQGYALARTAAARGAEVVLVSANVALPDPAGAKVVRVVSAEDLAAAVSAEAADADAVVMAAAVADFRPATRTDTKIKKTGADPDPLVLVTNPDVLAALSADRGRTGQVIVGFAAETGDASGDVLAHGRAKLARKGCDLLVVNDVSDGRGFERRNPASARRRRVVDRGAAGPRSARRPTGTSCASCRAPAGEAARERRRVTIAVDRRPRGCPPRPLRELRVHRLFTSDSRDRGSPDKIADQISDAVLDALLKEDPRSRVAVETLITDRQVHVAER
jgi:hypothetical protein